MTSSEAIQRARTWLVESGIRSREPQHGMPAGGVRRAFDAPKSRYEPFYPEITGYAVSFHLALYRDNDASSELQLAIQSAEWLTRTQHTADSRLDGAFPFAVTDEGRPAGGWYSFDTAVAGLALLCLGLEISRNEFIESACLAGNWLLSMQNQDGSFRAYQGSGQAVSWARDGNCLHGKHAVLLLELWELTGEKRFRDAAERCLKWLQTLVQANGAVFSSTGRPFVFLHSHCYATEGLLAGARQLETQSLVDSFQNSCRFLKALQKRSGGFPRYCGAGSRDYLVEMGSRLPSVRQRLVPRDVGATAQALRLLCWANAFGTGDYVREIDRGMRWLDRYQISDTDIRSDGAYPAAVDEFFGWRRTERRIYPWVAIFAADAGRLAVDQVTEIRIF